MATSISAATASAVLTGSKGARQFQGMFDVIPFKASLLDASLPAGASVADITVPGAELGDFVFVAPTIDSVDTVVLGFVQSADTVTLVIRSLEEVDASTTWATTAKQVNGFILKPKSNVFDQVS
jgi:hypothetical protein